MKILLFTLLLLTFLQAKSISLLLPHQYDAVMHQLNEHLLNAETEVHIVTPYLQNFNLKKDLLSLLQNNVSITLVTSSQTHMAANLVQYKHLDFHLLKNTKLNFSLIIIDNKFTCKLSSAFDENRMKSDLSFFECSTTNYSIKDANKIFKSIISLTLPYLEKDF